MDFIVTKHLINVLYDDNNHIINVCDILGIFGKKCSDILEQYECYKLPKNIIASVSITSVFEIFGLLEQIRTIECAEHETFSIRRLKFKLIKATAGNYTDIIYFDSNCNIIKITSSICTIIYKAEYSNNNLIYTIVNLNKSFSANANLYQFRTYEYDDYGLLYKSIEYGLLFKNDDFKQYIDYLCKYKILPSNDMETSIITSGTTYYDINEIPSRITQTEMYRSDIGFNITNIKNNMYNGVLTKISFDSTTIFSDVIIKNQYSFLYGDDNIISHSKTGDNNSKSLKRRIFELTQINSNMYIIEDCLCAINKFKEIDIYFFSNEFERYENIKSKLKPKPRTINLGRYVIKNKKIISFYEFMMNSNICYCFDESTGEFYSMKYKDTPVIYKKDNL